MTLNNCNINCIYIYYILYKHIIIIFEYIISRLIIYILFITYFSVIIVISINILN